MRYVLLFIFVTCLSNVNAQSNSKTSIEGPDSLNTTFVASNMLAKYDIEIVSSMDYIDIINVYEPTEIILVELNGKLIYKEKIEHRTRIEKDRFAKGFYIIKTRSVKMESLKKICI